MMQEMRVKGLHKPFGLGLLALGHRIFIHILKHKRTHARHGRMGLLGHENIVFPHAGIHDIMDEMIETVTGRTADHIPDLFRHVALF